MRWLPMMVLAAFAFAATGIGKPPAAQAQLNFSSNQAQKFVNVAGGAIRFSIAAGELALVRSQSPEVRAYAQQMVSDYTMALNDLSRVAAESSLNMPPTINGGYGTRLTALQVATADSFDGLYMDAAAKATKEAKYFLGMHARSEDPRVQQFAARMLPVLNSHGTKLQQFAQK